MDKDIVVRTPTHFMIVSVLVIALFIGADIVAILSDSYHVENEIVLHVVMLVGSLIMCIPILNYINFEVRVRGNIVQYTNMFGRRKVFHINDIKQVRFLRRKRSVFVVVYTYEGDELFSFHKVSRGCTDFLNLLESMQVPIDHKVRLYTSKI